MAGEKTDDEMEELKSRLNNYRKKLLDFTALNPLISAFSSRRLNSYIRVIDEQPQQVLKRIYDDEKPMEFVPLPSNSENPKDEESEEFKIALEEARKKDDEYLLGKAEIEANKENIDKKEYER